jgi:hypothetical protein
MAVSNFPEFRVNQFHNLIQRVPIAFLPCMKQTRNLAPGTAQMHFSFRVDFSRKKNRQRLVMFPQMRACKGGNAAAARQAEVSGKEGNI